MANRYWVGGSGSWDATTTTNWSATSGGSSGASAPTSSDSVIFDANSNTGTGAFTVTVGTNAACLDFSTGGAGGALDGAMTLTMGATAFLDCYGSFTSPVTNFSTSGTIGCEIRFLATATGKTITTNGVAFTNIGFRFNSTTGGWTFGSALNAYYIIPNAGTIDTGNFSLTLNNITRGGTATTIFNLNGSTVTLTGTGSITFTSITGLTFNAGTSQITCSSTSPTFAGGGLTFYNVTFSSTALVSSVITGSNTFNNFSITPRAASGNGLLSLASGSTNTINGTLTLSAGSLGASRLLIFSSLISSQANLVVASLASMNDIDFRDIVVTGTAAPLTGTRIGNCLNNSGITFDTPKTVYWVSVGSNNWSVAAGWSNTSGGTGDTIYFPLAQDTAIIDNARLTAGNTITYNVAYPLGNITFASRSLAATFANSAAMQLYGDFTLSSAITMSGAGGINCVNTNKTITITSAGVSYIQGFTLSCVGGTVRLNGNMTLGSAFTTTINSGTLDLTNNGAGNYVLSTGLFSSSVSNTRSIAFGTGNITLTGSGGNIWTTQTATNFTVTGTPLINCTYNGSVGTRGIVMGASTEANAISVNISAGSDIFSLATTSGAFKNIDFTGFSGTASPGNTVYCYGNFIASTGMTFGSSAGGLIFGASSGTQLVTTYNKTLDFPITFGVAGSTNTVQLQDNFTVGSTRLTTLTGGTLNLNGKVLSTGLFASSNSNTRSISFGTTGNITLTGNAGTIWTSGTATNFSYTGTPTINATYSGSTGTRTIAHGTTASSGTEANSPSFNITAGTDTVAFSTVCKNADFTGFAGTLANGSRSVYGNLTLSSAMTVAAGASGTGFRATSGTQLVTTNGQTLDFPVTQDGIGGTVQLQDNTTVGTTRTYTLTNGTLDLNGNTLSTGLFSSANSNARTIAFGAGTIAVTATGTAFNAATSTNLTVTGQTTGTIDCTSASAKTFAGGGIYYPKLNQGGAGALTITGANTFYDIRNTVQPATIIFPASTTTSVKNFNVNGTAGNLISLRSSTTGTRYTLALVS